MELKGVWLFLFIFNLIGVSLLLIVEMYKIIGVIGLLLIASIISFIYSYCS